MSNPLLCNPESGGCELPQQPAQSSENILTPPTNQLLVHYFTDPICSTCWGIEPQLRKLKLAWGHLIRLEYHMGGLLPNWKLYNSGSISKPSDVAPHWEKVSQYYRMPIDGNLWLEDPLPSSYPPSIAFKAAQLQDRPKALVFLRYLREAVFMEKKNICKWEYILEAARKAELNTQQLAEDFLGQGKRQFEDDLALSRQWGVRGFPTFLFVNPEGSSKRLYGFKPYDDFENIIRELLPQEAPKDYERDALSLFGHFPTLTTREFAELSGLEWAAAEVLLCDQQAKGALWVMEIQQGKLWKRMDKV